MEQLLSRIAARTASVGIIGQGYVGLPLGLVFQEAGFRVIGFDLDTEKVDAINAGRSYIRHISAERIAKARGSGRLEATTDFDRLADCDAILICVPTPLGKHREPDNSYIHSSAKEIAKRLRKGQLVVLESTTYPGTTDDEVRPILEAGGLKCPEDFLVAFSPEREDPGNPHFSTRSIPKVVGGVTPACTEAAVALYSAALDKVVPVASAKVAESCKLLENIYRSVNIALVNELKITFSRMGIDIWEVIEAAKTKPFGFQAFYPGPGLGGHCIPLDPFYLSWKASEFGVWTRFIELAGELNTRMPHYVFQRVQEGLNMLGRSVRGANILVLGLAYKADVDDDRESPSYELIRHLQLVGANVAYCDPYFPEMPAAHARMLSAPVRPVAVSQADFAKFDALLISTAHSAFKNPALYRDLPLVIDSRNVVAPLYPGARNSEGPRLLVKA